MPRSMINLLALSLAVVALAGCHRGDKAADKAAVQAPVPVETRTVGTEAIARILIANGAIIPRSQIIVLPKTSGRLAELRVAEGDRVHAGQVIAVLDTPELGWQLRQSKSGLLSAQANLDQAQDNLHRMKELAGEGVISQQQFKSAETQARLAVSQVNQTKAAISLMESQVANGTITSPIDGVVISKGLDVGAMAMPSTPIVTIAQSGALQVKLPIAERDLPMIREGGTVQVSSVAVPGKTYRARIAEIAPMIDPQTRLITVKANLENAETLKVGMNVSAAISGPSHQGLCIPVDALLTDGAEQIVFVAHDSKAERVRVTSGLHEGARVEITSGLKGGEQLIVKGSSFVKDSDPIRVNGGKL